MPIEQTYEIGVGANIAVPNSITMLAQIRFPRGAAKQDANDAPSEIAIEVKNSGATAFNAFQVRHRPHPGAQSYIYVDSTSEFADGTLIGCVKTDGTVGDPTVLAAGATVLLMIPRIGNYAIELYASVASGSTTAELRWGGA
jgi:hypothetical protein